MLAFTDGALIHWEFDEVVIAETINLNITIKPQERGKAKLCPFRLKRFELRFFASGNGSCLGNCKRSIKAENLCETYI